MLKTLNGRLLILTGTISTGLGVIGIFIPVLPTTPFLLLAAACYMRSSERFYRWLLNNRLFGTYISDYIEGKGMPLRKKVVTILLLWIIIGLTATLGVQNIAVRIALVIIAIGVTVYIILIRTNREKNA